MNLTRDYGLDPRAEFERIVEELESKYYHPYMIETAIRAMRVREKLWGFEGQGPDEILSKYASGALREPVLVMEEDMPGGARLARSYPSRHLVMLADFVSRHAEKRGETLRVLGHLLVSGRLDLEHVQTVNRWVNVRITAMALAEVLKRKLITLEGDQKRRAQMLLGELHRYEAQKWYRLALDENPWEYRLPPEFKDKPPAKV